MVKIDLKALQKKDSKEEENIFENDHNDVEIKTEEENIPKKAVRISLKDLKISGKEWKKIETTNNEKKDIEKVDVSEVVEVKKELPKISISTIKEEKVETPEVIIEDKIEEKISDNQKENLVKKESLYIADGDTTCRINNEKTQEIFSNYKWSYSKEIVEDKVEEKELKSETVETQKIEEIQEITKKEEWTNLEKFKKWGKKIVLTKRKKIALWVSLSLMVVFASIFSIFSPNPVKTSVIKHKKELKNDIIPPPPEKHIIMEREVEKINDNINWDIVKENELINFDNVEKNGNINKSVEDYLTKKFKK